MKKLIDLSDSAVYLLNIEAAKMKMSFKKYVETLLEDKARQLKK